MKRVGALFSFLFCSFLIFFSFSCRLYKLERKLNPLNAEFLSKVSYIITGEERKIFLELPDSEKEKFKEEFWKRRDPDPETEENEFKMEYLNRLEEAEKLFIGEGRPGWLTDRGRIYVLFGPPTDRVTYPMGREPSDPRREIWYYGNFPVVFVDSAGDGIYYLVTYDLSSIRSLNLMYLHELNQAQIEAGKTFKKEQRFLDFNWSVKNTFIEEEKVGGAVVIEIPYAAIWFKGEEDRLETTLDVHLDLKDFENNIIWEYDEAFEIAMQEIELKNMKKENYKIEISFILGKNLDRLRLGKNLMHAVIENRTGEEKIEKVIEFKILPLIINPLNLMDSDFDSLPFNNRLQL
jgi:GWxTD domain-containing protein